MVFIYDNFDISPSIQYLHYLSTDHFDFLQHWLHVKNCALPESRIVIIEPSLSLRTVVFGFTKFSQKRNLPIQRTP